MELLRQLEHSGIAMMIKQSTVLYEIPLVLHAVGMALLVGFSTGLYLRILGFAPSLPLRPMEQFFPVMYAGFWLNALSGVVLFSLYPVKVVTNPVFFVKMAGVVLAVFCLRRIRRQVFDNPGLVVEPQLSRSDRMLAAAAMSVWLVTVTAGRLMAYHGIAGVEWTSALAVLVVSVLLVSAGGLTIHLLGDRQSSAADVHHFPVGER